MKPIQVLFVPVSGALETATVETTVHGLQAPVGGLYERVTLSSRCGRTTLLHVNEEGLLLDLPVNPRLTEAFGMPLLGYPLHGNGYIAAVTGNQAYSSLTSDEIESWTRMLMLLQPDRLKLVKKEA